MSLKLSFHVDQNDLLPFIRTPKRQIDVLKLDVLGVADVSAPGGENTEEKLLGILVATA